MARHFLGVLGAIAAGILLAVSAAMNYRFGVGLGKAAMDGQFYGLASAAELEQCARQVRTGKRRRVSRRVETLNCRVSQSSTFASRRSLQIR